MSKALRMLLRRFITDAPGLVLVLCVFFQLSSCSNKFRINVIPSDATILVDGGSVKAGSIFESKTDPIELSLSRTGYSPMTRKVNKGFQFGVTTLDFSLIPNAYEIEIATPDCISSVFINSAPCGKTGDKLRLEYGTYSLRLSNPMFPFQEFILNVRSDGLHLFRLQEEPTEFKQIGIFPCGAQPKQVLFSPDDRYIFIPLLSGFGFEVFNREKQAIDRYVRAPDPSRRQGFPEGLFIEEKSVFWVSQMSTGKIYEYSLPDIEYVRTIASGGIWSKFMAWSPVLELASISNWCSNDVSIIEFKTGKVIARIKTPASPRGLAFSADGKYLYVTTFDGGTIHKVSTGSWKDSATPISIKYSCMRHVVLSKDDRFAFVSDMMFSRVYTIDTLSFKIIDTYRVDDNPNTIALTPDNRHLIVSGRGPNDSESYLKRSPRSGKIAIIDLVEKKVEAFLTGGNQPTGLAISHDGDYLCFSNFRDNNIELYSIENLKEGDSSRAK